MLGYPEKALASITESLALSERIAHPFTLSGALSVSSVVYLNRREPERALRQLEAAEVLAAEQRLSLMLEPGMLRGVALVAGGYFSWKMGRVSDDLESQWSLTSAQFKQRWDEGKRFELLARIGYGVGVAALAGSATCFLLGRRAAERERRLALAPLLVAGGGGGLLRVSY